MQAHCSVLCVFVCLCVCVHTGMVSLSRTQCSFTGRTGLLHRNSSGKLCVCVCVACVSQASDACNSSLHASVCVCVYVCVCVCVHRDKGTNDKYFIPTSADK